MYAHENLYPELNFVGLKAPGLKLCSAASDQNPPEIGYLFPAASVLFKGKGPQWDSAESFA